MKQTIEKLINWDEKIFFRLRGKGGKKLTNLMKFFAFFGREPFWLMITAFFIFVYINISVFLLFGDVLLFGLLIIQPIKIIIHRQRPYIKYPDYPPLETEQKSLSFPSWHSYNASANFILLSIIFKSWILTIIFMLFSAMIVISRIQLGSHYPLDAIIGFGIGFIGLYLSFLMLGPWNFLISNLEKISPYTFILTGWNIMLSYRWFAFIVVIVFFFILFVSFYKTFKRRKKKK